MNVSKILIATSNPGKKKALLQIVGKLPFEFLSLQDFPAIEEPEETGQTFTENAQLKAKFYAEKFNLPAIGEDSGLILEAFPEKFGVRTRREIDAKDDIEWLRLFLDLLENEANKNAAFFSAISFYDPKTKKFADFFGEIKGEIVDFPAAPIEKGIPVSAVFKPLGELDVFSAMPKEKRNAISHRGQAANGLKTFLKNL